MPATVSAAHMATVLGPHPLASVTATVMIEETAVVMST